MNQRTAMDQEFGYTHKSAAVRMGNNGRPCFLLPLLENALPLVRLRIDGQLLQLEPQQVVIQCEQSNAVSIGSRLAVGLTVADRRPKFAAVVVDDVRRLEDSQAIVTGHFGGPLQRILEQDVLRPALNPNDTRCEHDISERILDRLADAGVLERTIVDRIQVCPQCGGMPVCRSVCHACHSSRVVKDELVHHFACAYVASVDHFRHGGVLRCPKCQMGPLIVGADFEYLPGLHTCLDCLRVGSQLQLRAECMICQHDFSFDEAASRDLVGFHTNRLDPVSLALQDEHRGQATLGR